MMKENEQEKRETIVDIVEIVRRAAQYYEGEAEKSEGLLRESFKLSAANYREIANLVEAAWKRERAKIEADALACGGIVEASRHTPGNAAAMREALMGLIDGMCFHCDLSEDCKGAPCEKMQKAKAALSAPPRQCDVGTAEEQGERCMAQFNRWRRKGDGRKLITAIMAWAQTPYEAEEGGEK